MAEEMKTIDVKEVDPDGSGGLEWMICCGANEEEAKRLGVLLVADDKLMREQAKEFTL